MFGSKLRTWMEARIVRSKKKKDRKKGEKGVDRNQSANRSPALHQVHPIGSPAKNVDAIGLQAGGSYSGTGTGTGSVNLSSPESAYSTGYSTDGTSPGTSFPPEYYINVRTGTHYFQSSGGSSDVDPPATGPPLSGRVGEQSRSSKIRDRGPELQRDGHHRRTESFSADSAPLSIPPPPLLSSLVQSPRERSRIRTNPWLSANSSGFKSRLNLDDTSGSSVLKLTESSGSASDVNVNSARVGKESKQESLSAGTSPINQNWRIASVMEIRGKTVASSSSSSSSSSCSSVGGGDAAGASSTSSVRSSEDDITLNEMMGKFDESYVYEKETDILSDSDPTDCEDYVDSLSDPDAAREAPLENRDLDYIDNGSFLDLRSSGRVPNSGHCTYFTFTGELARPTTTLRESLSKRRIDKATKRQSTRHKKSDEKRKKKVSQRRRDDETANLNRVLVERMLLKNSGFNQGSRSLGATPVCLRRKKHDFEKNSRLPDDRSAAIDAELVKRRSNSVSYANGRMVKRRETGHAFASASASEIALIEADKEADKKYRELILEAENILVNMQRNESSSPIVPSPPSRKIHNGVANKRVELIKNTELALSKSRNSQPELQSGSIRDLEHASPKRQFAQPCSPIRRFIERNTPKQNSYWQESPKPRGPRARICQQENNRSTYELPPSNCPLRTENILRGPGSFPNFPSRENCLAARSAKEEGITSSSSDSEYEICDVRKRAPLMTFRSVDMGPIKESYSYCPQSEPVKRKVYAGSATYGRIRKTLGEHVALRNSDGDTATDDTDDSRRSLKEKVALLRRERLLATTAARDSQLRRQMLMQTIEGLKRSLEDQSATLKQTCFEPVLTDHLP